MLVGYHCVRSRLADESFYNSIRRKLGKMNTGTKIIVCGVLAILVIALSGNLGITQVKALSEESQKELQIQNCLRLSDKMGNDANATAEYKSEGCVRLLSERP